ncbi:MAG: 16S rRNA processing protein RimM [Verrucomicrobiaceae bacterium]|nr:MAG: 16S rRNA processing protein RimM [Verrucomicrobiaceae bacterium]
MTTPPSKEPTFIRVGQIVGAFGLKGQIKIQPLTDFAETRFFKGARLRMGSEWVEIQSISSHKGRPLVKLKGIDTIEAAEALQWKYLEAADRPKLAKNEYLVKDLVGLTVRTVEGESLGTIEEILPNPAHEILVVGEIMIPLIEQFVKKIDLPAKTVTVQLIPGMLPGEF